VIGFNFILNVPQIQAAIIIQISNLCVVIIMDMMQD